MQAHDPKPSIAATPNDDRAATCREATMKRLALVTLFLISPASAFAAGYDITWNDCIGGTTGTMALNQMFDCAAGGANRNYSLHIQYKSPVAIPDFVAVTAWVQLADYGAQLSPFWHYEGGGCNGGTVKGASIQGSMPAGCAGAGYQETWNGGPGGTFGIAHFGDYTVIIPNHSNDPDGHGFLLFGAREDAYPVNAGDNMWAFELRFNNRNRIGSAANCAGCSELRTVVIDAIRLEGNSGGYAMLLNTDKLTDTVTINDAPVLTRSTTWGRLKSMFR